MRVLSFGAFRDFWEKEHRSENVLRDCYKKLNKSNTRNLAELKQQFPAVDLVGKCYVFNVGGNKYRVIVRIHFNRQMAFIRYVLTHSEYDKGNWKVDC
ncbi:MAG: type II toxin-antitoxin system HigB family toxin [Pyrinomonadaceae bacterium]